MDYAYNGAYELIGARKFFLRPDTLFLCLLFFGLGYFSPGRAIQRFFHKSGETLPTKTRTFFSGLPHLIIFAMIDALNGFYAYFTNSTTIADFNKSLGSGYRGSEICRPAVDWHGGNYLGVSIVPPDFYERNSRLELLHKNDLNYIVTGPDAAWDCGFYTFPVLSSYYACFFLFGSLIAFRRKGGQLESHTSCGVFAILTLYQPVLGITGALIWLALQHRFNNIIYSTFCGLSVPLFFAVAYYKTLTYFPVPDPVYYFSGALVVTILIFIIVTTIMDFMGKRKSVVN